MASAYDCDSRLSNRVHIPAHIKDQRRIVDLLELWRIGGIVQADDSNSGCGNASHFVMRQLDRLPRAQRLRRNGLNAGGLEFSQRCLENVLDTAEVFDQPARTGRAQTRGQGKGDPL